MPSRRAVLLTPSDDGKRPIWSYRYTGTLFRLISFVSRDGYENESSLFYSSSFFSNSCSLFCIPQKLNPFLFKQFRTLLQKHPGVGVPSPTSQINAIPAHDHPSKCLPHNLFVDPHLLNLYATIFYKKGGREGVSRTLPLLFALFAPRANTNSFTFCRFRTLSKNNRGGGYSSHFGTNDPFTILQPRSPLLHFSPLFTRHSLLSFPNLLPQVWL
jgi:hypothetical protein